jgi:hypothetical protein
VKIDDGSPKHHKHKHKEHKHKHKHKEEKNDEVVG